MIGTTTALWRLLRIAVLCRERIGSQGRELLVAPILKGQVDAGLLNGLKIFRVAGHKRQPKPYRDSSNEAIGKFENGTLLTGGCLAAAR